MLLVVPVFGRDGVVVPPLKGGNVVVPPPWDGVEGTEGVWVPKGPSPGVAGTFSEPILAFKSGVAEPAGPSPGVAGTLSASNTGMVERTCVEAVGAVYL